MTRRTNEPMRHANSSAPVVARWWLAVVLVIILSLPVAASGAVAAVEAVPPVGRAQPAPATQPAYRWPLPGPPPVVRAFDPPAARWLPGHRGVDLAAPPGSTVTAAGGGVVFFAGLVAGRPVVSIAHPDGLRTTYEPVAPSVTAGEVIAAGDPIGELGSGHAGCPAPACLHWGLRRGDIYLDPLSLLGLGRVRLLPRAGA